MGGGIKGITVAPDEWMNWIGKVDCATITGSEHRGHIPSYLRKNGVPVAGPGPWSSKLELDRAFGQKVLTEMGLRPPKTEVFTRVSDVINHIESNPARYVFKLDQTARSVSETFPGQDPDGRDVADHLRKIENKLRFAEGLVKFYLEEAMKGTEVGVGGWFNGERFLNSLMVTYEDHGGYAYDFRVTAEKLLDEEKIASVLRKHKYRGTIDINGFLTEDGYRAIEFTPRWGGGTTEFMCHAAEDLGELLYACATGGETQVLRKAVSNGGVTALVNAVVDEVDDIPWPITLPNEKGAVPVAWQGDSSFWMTWPSRSSHGWVNLPVLPLEKRVGSYVATASSMGRAFRKIDDLSGRAYMAAATVELGRAKEELVGKVDKVYRYLMGYEWVDNLAEETRLMYAPLKRTGSTRRS